MTMRAQLGFSLLLILFGMLPGCLDAEKGHIDYQRARAEALLGAEFAHLVVEIEYAQGFEPLPFAMETLRDTLENVTDKDSIVFRLDALPANDSRFIGRRAWNDTRGLHAEFFDSGPLVPYIHAAEDTAYLHIFLLNGYLQTDETQITHGIHTEDGIFLFPDEIRNYRYLQGRGSDGIVNPFADRVERHVLIHELGHALGLIDSGVPMLHPRKIDGAHSSNPESVMRPHIDPSLAFRELVEDGSELPYKFDRHDLEDLRAVRDAVRARVAERGRG